MRLNAIINTIEHLLHFFDEGLASQWYRFWFMKLPIPEQVYDNCFSSDWCAFCKGFTTWDDKL